MKTYINIFFERINNNLCSYGKEVETNTKKEAIKYGKAYAKARKDRVRYVETITERELQNTI